MPFLNRVFPTIILGMFFYGSASWAQVPPDSTVQSPGLDSLNPAQVPHPAELSAVSRLDGVHFVSNSNSQILLEKGGKQYLIDTQTKTIHEVSTQAQPSNSSQTPSTEGKSSQPSKSDTRQQKEKEVYYTEDINLWTLPTTHPLEKKALIIDFTHRFALDDGRPFKGQAMNYLFGLDGYSFSSFGLTYGITDRFFAGAYRVPTGLGRIIQLSGGAQLSQESKGHPFSSTFRVAVEGANHFRENYVTSLELAVAKSIKKRAQLYFVPTLSFNARPLVTAFGEPVPRLEKENIMALGAGLSVDFRPTVAFVAEAIIRTNGFPEERHRPSFMFGVQKKLFRHSFTLGVSNSAATTVSQRSATRGALGLDDSFGGLTIGFNLSRRLF
jgi:hypothetical protein